MRKNKGCVGPPVTRSSRHGSWECELRKVVVDLLVIKESEGINSVVLLTPPPELSLIGSSYIQLTRSCVTIM